MICHSIVARRPRAWPAPRACRAMREPGLSVAHRTGAIEIKDLERVVVDTTVQEKAIAHPIDVEDRFGPLLDFALRIHHQDHR
jgi:hypothetical protein